MTTERLVTEYTADTRNFRRGARVYDQTLARQERLTNDRLSRIDRRWERSTRSILNTRTALSGLTGLLGGAALNQLRNYAEGWRDVERRLQSIGVTSEEAQKGLVALSLRTRSSIGGTAAAVQRMAKSTGDGIEITTRRVETLQKLLAAGGASGSERASVSLQLGQALQSGVLSGDEFRSIRENAPVEFLDALAKAAGITRQELKGFAEDQKLTSDIVLRALDGLASTADEKFGALAISGEEAFSVLSTGLTAYAGNVDKALGATETINGALVWLGEYLSDAGDGAETMAKAIRIVGTVALTTAGSRGLGALNSAFRRSAETASFVAQEAQKEVAVSRQKVVAAQQELAASRALVAQRQAEVIARMQSNLKLTGAMKKLKAAKDKNARASVALFMAEGRAAGATDRLAEAQKRLAWRVRATATAWRAAKGVFAFFGGPLGVAVTAASVLPQFFESSAERLEDLNSAAGVAKGAMERYAAASRKATGEQRRLAGGISAATQQMLAQSRVEMQASLKDLTENFERTFDDIRSSSRGVLIDAIGVFRVVENGFGYGALAEGEGLEDRIQKLNPILGSVLVNLRNIADGNGDLHELAASLEQVLGVGDEAERVLSAWKASLEDPSQIEAGRAALLSYAEATGLFAVQIQNVRAAQGEVERVRAFDVLAAQLSHAVQALKVLDETSIDALWGLVKSGTDADLMLRYMQASLEGNKEEAARLWAELEQGVLRAQELGSTSPPDFSGAADSAEKLADQLERATNAAISLRAQSVTGLQRARIENKYRTDPIARARALAEAEYDNRTAMVGPLPDGAAEDLRRERAAFVADRVEAERLRQATIAANRADSLKNRGGGGGSSALGTERGFSEARKMLVENGQKALYIEQELNAERERLRELLPSLIEMGLSRADADAVINSELERTEERLKRVKTASEEAAESFAKGILSDIRHADNLGDAIGRIGDRLLDLALDPIFDFLAQQFASLGTGGGGGGLLGQIFGFLFSANGNAFNSAGVVPFARGGVVDRPTLFNFAGNRKGVMGEAGPEAILPLSRGKNGKLGVVAELPTTPSMPAGGMQANSTFSWTGDMVIQSNSDQPQEIGKEATDQMRAMFVQMFTKQLGDAMRGGGVLNSTYQKKAGA